MFYWLHVWKIFSIVCLQAKLTSVNSFTLRTDNRQRKFYSVSDFSAIIRSKRRHLGLTQAEFGKLLGLSASYVHQLEAKKRSPSELVIKAVANLDRDTGRAGHLADEARHYQAAVAHHRRIPVLGWAHAGEALDYEEIVGPDYVPTDCRDVEAFAVRLEGDSMAPAYEPGDLLVLMPGAVAHAGHLVVVRLSGGGVLFRRLVWRDGQEIRLMALNPAYGAQSLPVSDVLHCWPLWGVWRQVWK